MPNPSRKKSKQRFSSIPHCVIDSEDFRALSGTAVKALVALARQYNGFNNGDLHLARKPMNEQFGIGHGPLHRARNELLERNLITQTRAHSWPGGVCSLFALNWEPINECGGKLDVAETTKPPRNFALENNRAKNKHRVPNQDTDRSRKRPQSHIPVTQNRSHSDVNQDP